jgi:HAMP domain-containing protein
MKISLAAKFNLVLLLISGGCLVATGYIAQRILQGEAREEVLENARLLMDSGLAVATYTSQQVVPLLENQMKYKFLPQSVPAYAATENLNALRDAHPDYSYKNAMLNPTNPRDRATDWEAQVIEQLRDRPSAAGELIGERDAAVGRALYIARPIVLKSHLCLQCHDKASEAPRSLVDAYGSANGFNWSLNEVIGAQIVSVPMSAPKARADKIFKTFMLSILVIFALVFVALNIMVRALVTRRLTALSRIADEVSMGKLDGQIFDTPGQDELSDLARSFERMRSSLVKALKMLEQ